MMPSGLVITAPAAPTATNCPPPYAMPFIRGAPTGLTWVVHVMPSGLVITAPAAPTATNCPPPYVISSPPTAAVLEVHVMPSGLVITRLSVPLDDTATKRPLAKVTDLQ